MIAKYAVVLLLFIPVVQQKTITDKVIHVLDGDTIEILYEGAPLRIRLNGIDCPEKAQRFGAGAKEETSRRGAGLNVTVVSRGKDRYGRTLGDVFLPDSCNLNQGLVRKGLAWHYREYSSDKILALLETVSMSNRVGLWQDADPTMGNSTNGVEGG